MPAFGFSVTLRATMGRVEHGGGWAVTDEQYDEIQVVEDAPRATARYVVPEETSYFRRNLTVILWSVVLVALALFIGQNWRSVRMEAFFWSFTIKLSFALLAAALFGLLLGFFIPVLWRRRRQRS